MKVLILIRVCPRDQELAARCERTFEKVIKKCDIRWFAEEGEYKLWTFSPFIWHPFFDNYGGRDYVLPFIEELKKLNVRNYDYIILTDSDIQLLKNPLEQDFEFGGIQDQKNGEDYSDLVFHQIQNPLEQDFEFGGIQDQNNLRHFSGQMLIFKRELFEKVLAYKDIYKLTEELIEKNISIADDTILSWIATEYTNKTYNFYDQDYWIHSKEI